MPKKIRTLSFVVQALLLCSACTLGQINPQDDHTPEVIPPPEGYLPPVVITPPIDQTPLSQQTVPPPEGGPTDETLPTAASLDIVHLGMPWADFSLKFDPLQWEISAFDDEWPDLQALTHRTLAGCHLTPNIPVGLGPDWSITTKEITLGELELDSRSFYQDGVLIFVGYYNFVTSHGDGAVEVHFDEHADDCLQAAEALFAVTEVIFPEEVQP